jgi:broad specificity phosphatase PhoE
VSDPHRRVVHLVRHAQALDREAWHRPDALRPLTPRGEAQARAIGQRLAPGAPGAIVSSPAARCVATVAPLALATGVPVEELDALGEGGDPLAALDAVVGRARTLGAGRPLVACSHGDVIHGVLEVLVAGGVVAADQARAPKGATWELHLSGDTVDGAVLVAALAPPGDGRATGETATGEPSGSGDDRQP